MLRFVARRLLWAAPTMVLVTFVVYVAVRLGTDPVASYVRASGRRPSDAQIEQYIEANGLYDGAFGYVRGYLRWLGGFVTGDWPPSINGGREVYPRLKEAAVNSLRLGGVATIVGVGVGLGFGMLAATRPGGLRDTTVSTASFVGLAIPPYVSAVLLQMVFAVYWSRWFGGTLLPTSGIYPNGHRGTDLLLMAKHMVLPVCVVAIQIVAVYARYMRAALLDVLDSDYMRTARAKGISERQVLMRHAMRNALIPVVTVAAIDAGAIMGGLIITEGIFNYPGMGQYFLDAYAAGDFPRLMPWMVVVVASVILFNLLADLAYVRLDPRVGRG